MMKNIAFILLVAIGIASCGKITETTISGKTYNGVFFSITQPDGFDANAFDSGVTVSCKEYGIAVMATKNTTYKKNVSQLTGFGEEFKKIFEKPTVIKEQFAGQNALYLESWKDGKMSFGYSFIIDGAMITVNASSVPQDKIEEASIILHTFKLINERYFTPKPDDAQITQFGPSDGNPIRFDKLILTPPKGWRILDNSTPDFISIEPRENNTEDGGQGIHITVIQGPPTKANQEAQTSAKKAGVTVSKEKIGDIEFVTFTAQYQQMTFVYVTDVGDRQYWINISGPIDTLTPKLKSFLSSLAFGK